MKTNLHIEPYVKTLFDKEGLNTFSALYSLSDEKVERLILGNGQVFYLKRTGRVPVIRQITEMLFGYFPHSIVIRELKMLQKLQQAGFQTMEPVAWGERRKFGLSVGGVLVVREVQGEEFAQLYDAANGLRKKEFMKEVGFMIGQLHAKGFFQPVRLKDIIYSEKGMVLIDRETSKPRQSLFLKKKCLSNLARAARRTLRDGHRFGAGSISAFLKGYQKGIASRWKILIPGFRKDLMRALRSEMG